MESFKLSITEKIVEEKTQEIVEEKNLSSLPLNGDIIIIKRVQVNDNIAQKLTAHLRVTTTLPYETYSYVFHPLSYFSNKNPGAVTDRECNFPIDNCKNTTIRIESVFYKDITLTIFYEEPKFGRFRIDVIEQIGGITFQLPIESYQFIKEHFPKAFCVRNVFISYTTLSDFQSIHGAIGIHIIQALCGLTDEEIRMIDVEFINPQTEARVDIKIRE